MNQTSQTFEERIGAEIDALYQGARFLAGGTERRAEAFLTKAITMACDRYEEGTQVAAFGAWTESFLVRVFLREAGGTPTPADAPDPASPQRTLIRAAALAEIGPEELFRAAAAVPVWPRAALWLVLLRRWSHREAAEVMGIARPTLEHLLRYRHVLLRELLSGSEGRKDTLGLGS